MRPPSNEPAKAPAELATKSLGSGMPTDVICWTVSMRNEASESVAAARMGDRKNIPSVKPAGMNSTALRIQLAPTTTESAHRTGSKNHTY